jgi:hypothetical protein
MESVHGEICMQDKEQINEIFLADVSRTSVIDT